MASSEPIVEKPEGEKTEIKPNTLKPTNEKRKWARITIDYYGRDDIRVKVHSFRDGFVPPPGYYDRAQNRVYAALAVEKNKIVAAIRKKKRAERLAKEKMNSD